MLHKLGLKYGTDKATYHGYTHEYEKQFQGIREDVKNVLEIGTAEGYSVQMWRDYFPNATIYTVDIRSDVYKYPEDDRIVLCIYNFGKHEDDDESHTHQEYKLDVKDGFKGINSFKRDLPIEFDVIIEDASHMMKDQQITLAKLFDQVKSGGIYVLEDLATSHKSSRWNKYKKEGDTNTLDMLKQFNETGKFESVHMTEEQMDYLSENIASCEICKMPVSTSILAFIRKK